MKDTRVYKKKKGIFSIITLLEIHATISALSSGFYNGFLKGMPKEGMPKDAWLFETSIRAYVNTTSLKRSNVADEIYAFVSIISSV